MYIPRSKNTKRRMNYSPSFDLGEWTILITIRQEHGRSAVDPTKTEACYLKRRCFDHIFQWNLLDSIGQPSVSRGSLDSPVVTVRTFQPASLRAGF